MKFRYIIILVIFLSVSACYSQELKDTLETVRDLQEFVIKASNISRKGNMESYIVTKDMKRGNKTAGELLRKVNGIYYQPVTEELTYLGSQNIVLLVDSIEKDVTYIKRQSPDRFDRIDVTPNPGGKYTGYDVLINLHTKPNYTGLETNMRGKVGFVPNNQNGKGDGFDWLSGYADVTYMRDKFNLYAIGNYTRNVNNLSIYSVTSYPINGYTETQVESDKKDPGYHNKSNSINFQLSGNYKINDKHRMALLWEVNPSSLKTSMDRLFLVSDNDFDDNNNLIRAITNGNYKGKLSNKLGLYYFGVIGKWHVDFSATYTHTKWTTYYDYEKSNGYALLYDRKNRLKYFWGGVSAYRWLGNKWYLGISDYLYITKEKVCDNYTNDIVSQNNLAFNNLYATIQFIPTRTLTFVADGGFSFYSNSVKEESISAINPRIRVMAQWYPCSKFSTQILYNVNTSMPAIASISDNGQFINEYIYQCGNPELKPITTHRLSARFVFCRRLNITADYTFSNTRIFNIYNTGIEKSEADIFYYVFGKYQNGKYRELSLLASYSQPFAKYFNINMWGKASRMHASYENAQNTKWLPYGGATLWFSQDKFDFNVMLSYELLSSDVAITPQRYDMVISDNFILGIQASFFKSKLTMGLSWYMPIHIAKGDYRMNLTSPNMMQAGWGNNQFRRNNKIEFAFIYRFSNGKQIKKENLNTRTLDTGSQFGI